ncbi:PTS N-acetylgalactosamine transporter subunit IIC [Pasteurella atlantica]|uniref:PTS N-acetylgalactosamine transporter subunit IIC n=1 Tax=Phocoenobacter skyensis TaxID=97481 RepID=A0A1H7WLZ7_9PAST|nr:MULTISPECIES: PTS N-acetylgalactosamine transporter subunit IIC [Pasteurella]MDP8034172.1 PTS N-acetylgalactosamine transporter subunit IIC [Pasteurella atlantica]MDP8036049.1 PTS N-acetylgalactosamine transporter subunit IIC [Pasteurella atlantica]MDP8037999.1 PTS N-acetylgalactosamine transporter subunit IIC [Pasteurella atlantica]MDP8048410.1 PTS N-acetylgalactosamine transporter subunit IIC [Pasteurella atlantica]MDP8050311.1 PTS N-acetylgalactosamine transporter subunit IIC [Pasteurell
MEVVTDVSLMQALLIAIFAGIAGIDLFNVLTHIHRPIITGPIVGLILGKPEAGLVAGATFELMWMGLVPLAGAQPPNVVLGGIIGTAFALVTGQTAEQAILVAVPFAIFVQICITLLFTVYSPLMSVADRYAKNLNFAGIANLNYLGMTILFFFYSIIAFAVIYFGAEAAQGFVKLIPKWVTDGLGFAGGLMPAIGFGILLNIMLKKQYVAYFILGFLLSAYFKQPLLAIALIGLVFALIEFFIRGDAPAEGSHSTETEEEGI